LREELPAIAYTRTVAKDQQLPTVACAHSRQAIVDYAALFLLPRDTRGERETSPSLSMK
jgi:hypothetical protein